MKSELINLNLGINYLRHHVQGIELERRLLSHDFSGLEHPLSESLKLYYEHYKNNVKRRQFNYGSVIVSLYGYTEKFVESVIERYIKEINKLAPIFDDLPEKIIANNTALSLSLIDLILKRRLTIDLTEEEIISNLHSCYNKNPNYVLNHVAFSQHTANFRKDVIDRSFGNVGINALSETIRRHALFSDFTENFFSDRDAFDVLDDLAERRNQIAHGDTISDILSNEILLQYLSYIEIFGRSLIDAVFSELLSYEAKYKCACIGSPYRIVGRRSASSIACIELRDVLVRNGDRLIISPAEPNALCFEGVIESLQIDRQNQTEISAKNSLNVGMKVSFPATKGQTFYVRTREVTSEAEHGKQLLLPFTRTEHIDDLENEDSDPESK